MRGEETQSRISQAGSLDPCSLPPKAVTSPEAPNCDMSHHMTQRQRRERARGTNHEEHIVMEGKERGDYKRNI